MISPIHVRLVNTNIYLYADDTKVYKIIRQTDDQSILQTVINKIKEWSDEWLLQLNIDKCKVISYNMWDKLHTSYSIKEKTWYITWKT